MKYLLSGFLLFCLAFCLTGCYNDKYDQLYPASSVSPVTCDTTDSVHYSTDILPILTANCNIAGGCHDAAGSATSGFNFATYSGIASQARNGNLLGDINWVPTHNDMPKGLSKISQCDINKFTAWVFQGYKDN